MFRRQVLPWILASDVSKNNIVTGVPCQNCVSTGLSCTFPVRDRNIVVSETYIRRLQAQSHIHSETPSYVNVQATGDTSSRTSEVGLQASIPPTEGSARLIDRIVRTKPQRRNIAAIGWYVYNQCSSIRRLVCVLYVSFSINSSIHPLTSYLQTTQPYFIQTPRFS